MKIVNECKICGCINSNIIFSGEQKDPYFQIVYPDKPTTMMTWVSCDDCGLTYRKEQLDENENMFLYENYRSVLLSSESADEYFKRITSIPDNISENYNRGLFLKRMIEKFVKTSNQRHLDIGAGAGVFVHTFQRICPEIDSYVIEATPVFAQICKKFLGSNVHQGFYRPNLFNDKFTVLTLLQVLEHFHDPRETLLKVKSDLDSDGILFIEVPAKDNIDIYDFDHDLFCIPHIYMFSHDDFERLLKDVQLEIVYSETITSIARKTKQLRIIAKHKE